MEQVDYRRQDLNLNFTSSKVRSLLMPIARLCFGFIFILSSLSHFTGEVTPMAVAHNIPFAEILVPLSGAMALLGGLSVAIGFKTRFGAALLVLFLVPITLMMHNFWELENGAEAYRQIIHFLKNISMLGAAFILSWFGAGPYSFDNQISRSMSENG